jgi:hypothetical protein
VLAAIWLMPSQGKQKRAQLDLVSVLVLFAGLTLLVGPLLFGREFGWPQWSFVIMGVGAVLLASFPRLEQSIERRGGSPLIEPALLADRSFVRGTLAFVIAARRASTAQATGISVLIKGCAVQASGLASLAVLAACIDAPSMFALMVPLTLLLRPGIGHGATVQHCAALGGAQSGAQLRAFW